MAITGFGAVFLPLCLLCSLHPERLLQLVLVGAVFGSAAVVTVGDYGLLPALVPVPLFAAFMLLQWLLGAREAARSEAWRVVAPFVLVTLWAVLGAWLLPRLFAGAVEVWPQKPSPPFLPQPLAPSLGNLTQSLYLTASCLLLACAAAFFARLRLNPGRVLDAYLLGGFLAVALTLWQLANRLGAAPFPEALLYSNPGWSLLTDQRIGEVPRIGGPFSEPAALAGYMAGIVGATGWMIVNGHRGRAPCILLPLALTAMAVSTSTTGFAVLALLAAALSLHGVLRGSAALRRRAALVGAVLAAAGAVAGFAVIALAPAASEAAAAVLQATFGKGGSFSFQNRTEIDRDSLALLWPTAGLGVGLGSNRSASLLPGLLAGLGVPGVLGLAWFAGRVVCLASAGRRLARRPADARAMDGAAGSLVGTVVAALLSGPTITDPAAYLLLGLLIGTAARVRCEAQGRSGAGGTIPR